MAVSRAYAADDVCSGGRTFPTPVYLATHGVWIRQHTSCVLKTLFAILQLNISTAYLVCRGAPIGLTMHLLTQYQPTQFHMPCTRSYGSLQPVPLRRDMTQTIVAQ